MLLGVCVECTRVRWWRKEDTGPCVPRRRVYWGGNDIYTIYTRYIVKCERAGTMSNRGNRTEGLLICTMAPSGSPYLQHHP